MSYFFSIFYLGKTKKIIYPSELFFFLYVSLNLSYVARLCASNLAKHIKKITSSFGVDYFLPLPLLVLCVCISACTGDTQKTPVSKLPENDFVEAALQAVQDSMQLESFAFERVSDIVKKYETQIRAVQKQQFNDPKSKKQVMQNLLKSRRTELNDVLKRKEMMAFNKLYKKSLGDERKRARKEKQLSEEDRKALGEQIQAYRLESVMPVLKKQREALEAAMSPTDKTHIAGLREKIITFNKSVLDKKAACATLNKKNRKAKANCQRELQSLQKTYEPIRKEMKEIIKLLEERSSTQIIMITMENQRKQWRTDLKKMLDTYFEEKIEVGKVPLAKYFRLAPTAQFLMLNPENVNE